MSRLRMDLYRLRTFIVLKIITAEQKAGKSLGFIYFVFSNRHGVPSLALVPFNAG